MRSHRIHRTHPVLLRIASLAALLCFLSSPAARPAFARTAKVVRLSDIKIAPSRIAPGQHPRIEAKVSPIARAKRKSLAVTIIAVVTQPDHRVRSWNWKKVKLVRGTPRTISIPPTFIASKTGTYRVEIIIYSGDMRRRYARKVRSFTVSGRERKGPPSARHPAAQKKSAARTYASIGLYGNALNPAGGGTVLLWPSSYIGLQGIYSDGVFTSREGRLLIKFNPRGDYRFYCGVGYIHVETVKDVNDVTTRFADGRISGVVGIETSLGSRVLLSVESSAARIDLERTVVTGSGTVSATVKYAPVTVGFSLVMPIF